MQPPRRSHEHEFDFHGLRAEEAEARLRQILGRFAGSKGLILRIVHGKGDGILAAVVERVARGDPRVAWVQRQVLNDGVTAIEMSGSFAGKPPRAGMRGAAEPPVRRRKFRR